MACSSSPTGKANKSHAGILGIRDYAPTFKLIFCRRSYSLNFGGGASAFDRNLVVGVLSRSKNVKRVEMKRVCYFISRSFVGKIAERKCESKLTKM